MAYDQDLAYAIRAELAHEPGVTERAMFGGLGFMVNGNMAVAAAGSGQMMVRVDPTQTPELVQAPGVERMVMRGRAMNGWLLVEDAADDDARLTEWVRRGFDFARALPPK